MRSSQPSPAAKFLMDRITAAYASGPAPESLLDALAQVGHIAVVPELVTLLDADNLDRMRAFLRTIGILLDGTPPEQLGVFEEAIKSSVAFAQFTGRFDRRNYERVVRAIVDSPSLLATVNRLGVFHTDGFVREAAVTAIARSEDGSELAYLLCRLNDWVRPVRGAAREAVLRRLKPEYADAFACCLPLLVRISDGRRADHSTVMAGVWPLLTRPEARNTMLGWLRAGKRGVRRAALAALCAGSDPATFTQAALGSNDPALVRDWLRAAVASSSPASVRAAAAALIRHPIASLRRDGLLVLVEVGPAADAEAALEHALLDANASVRAAARDHLAARGQGRFDERYRAVLDGGDPAATVGTLGGLGETGTKEDASRVERFLASPKPAVSRAALRAFALLAGDDAREALFDRLGDASPSVSRTAARRLEPHASAIGAERLWQAYSNTPWQHTRRYALRLILLASKWDSITYLLLARCVASGADAVLIELMISQWAGLFNRNLSVPTPVQRQRAAAALQRCMVLTPDVDRNRLRFLIQ